MHLLWIILCIFAVLIVAAFLVSQVECGRIFVREYQVESDKVPEAFHGYRMLMFADMHNTQFGKDNERLLAKIREIGPEEIFIAGDMITYNKREGKKNYRAVDLLNALGKEYRVLYSMGNHEMKLKELGLPGIEDYKTYVSKLKGNITLLDNKTVQLSRGADSLRVTGLNLGIEYFERFKKATLTKNAIKEHIGEPNGFQILMAHDPEYFPAYADWGADLVMSGHFHGGIIRIPGLGGLVSPRLKLFPKYDRGLFEKGNSKMLVTAGLGTHKIKIRLFNTPELCVITLLKKSAN